MFYFKIQINLFFKIFLDFGHFSPFFFLEKLNFCYFIVYFCSRNQAKLTIKRNGIFHIFYAMKNQEKINEYICIINRKRPFGIAIIRLSGKNSLQIFAKLITKKNDIKSKEINFANFMILQMKNN